MKILVVDDNRALATVVQEVVESREHTAKTAGDGESGYSVYLDFEPDVVITDIHMPKKNGMQLMEAILKHNPRTKMVLMTGSPRIFGKSIDEVRERHRVTVLKKPFSSFELLGVLKNLE